jgi:WD40 repeat protein
MHISQGNFMAIVALCATMAVAGFAQIRPDITPGEIMIATSPQASIFLDDTELGAASASGSFVIHSAKPGPHTLRVTKESKHPFTKRIVVAAGKTNQVRAELDDVTGDLEVLTTAGAEIWLDGKSVGMADATGKLLIRGLTNSTYKVRAAKAGRSSEEQEASLDANLVTSVNLELKLADEVSEGTTTAPDYLLQRRLVFSAVSRVQEIFFQADSGKLVSITQKGDTGYITQTDPSTGRVLETAEVKARFGIIAVSPDLRLAALEVRKPRPGFNKTLESENSVQVVEVASGRVVQQWPGYYADFTPDSKRLAIQAWGHAKTVFWNIESGKQLDTWPQAKAESILYSPDGRRAATTGEEGVTIKDSETGKTIQQLPTGNCCQGAAFSPDGRWLAVTGNRDKIELWEIATGTQRRSFVSPRLLNVDLWDRAYFSAVIFTPDSRHIVSLEINDGNEVSIWLLDTLTGHDIRKGPLKSPVTMTLSRDGRWLAVLNKDASVTVWKRPD